MFQHDNNPQAHSSYCEELVEKRKGKITQMASVFSRHESHRISLRNVVEKIMEKEQPNNEKELNENRYHV